MLKNSKQYDLEDRTLKFAREVRELVKRLPKTMGNIEDGKQLIRASGSVGANYIEANEALSKKDFIMRIKICRKESKEARYWLKLIDTQENVEQENTRENFIKEATELMNIFGAILRKSENIKYETRISKSETNSNDEKENTKSEYRNTKQI